MTDHDVQLRRRAIVVEHRHAARRAFEVFVADLDPALRHRMGQKSYHQLKDVFAKGFEAGLGYQAETAPEPREQARP